VTKLKPILRVIDLVGDGRSMTLPIHPKVIARTHCVRFMDTYNGAEATIFMAADGWLMMRRVGNVWVWPPSEDVQAGAMLYAIGELVECNEKGEPVARRVPISVDEAIRAVGLDLDEALCAVGLAAFECGYQSPTHAAAEANLKASIEAEFAKRIATAPEVAAAIDALDRASALRGKSAVWVDRKESHQEVYASARRDSNAAGADLRTAIATHVESEVARRLAIAPGVEAALADLLGQVGCAAHHREKMADALRSAIAAHVEAEVNRRLAAAPSVKEAMGEFGAAIVEDAVGGHRAPSSRVVAALSGINAAIAADRERAVGEALLRQRAMIEVVRQTEADLEAISRPTTDVVDPVLFAIGSCHDGSDLWAHMKRDPDAFRRTVSRVLSGKIKPMPSPDEAGGMTPGELRSMGYIGPPDGRLWAERSSSPPPPHKDRLTPSDARWLVERHRRESGLHESERDPNVEAALLRALGVEP
jgi:hypothetical protein